LTVGGVCHALLGTLLGAPALFPVRYGEQAQEREEGGDQNVRGGAIALVGALILIIIMLIAFMFFLIMRQSSEEGVGETTQVVTELVTQEVTREVTIEPPLTQPGEQTSSRTQPER
jgi:hypothetical protein